MSSAIQPTENQLPGNSSVLRHNPLCLDRWLSQKVNNYQKISTLHLIFAVVIHSLQNNTFVRTKVSYFGTYLSIFYDEMLHRVLYLDNKKTSLFFGCIPAISLSGVYFLSLNANFWDRSHTYLVKTTD